ncbi:MAG: class I SAM-dependent methyltransferase [Candidatus Heimdallarchaeaceae archaeon]
MSTDKETLDSAFKDVGDVSGLTILDAGPEGVVSKYLVERIGDGRIIGINIWLEAYGMVRKRLGDKLMDKVVFIKDDIQHIDYLKDNYFDLVTSYETLGSIENMTPNGTLPIIQQFYRVLKQNGRFLAIEPNRSIDTKQANEAQENHLRFMEIIDQIKPFGKTYSSKQFSQILKEIGFNDINWKIVSKGISFSTNEINEMMDGIRNLANESIKNTRRKKNMMMQIEGLALQILKKGLQTLPYYALYARKP